MSRSPHSDPPATLPNDAGAAPEPQLSPAIVEGMQRLDEEKRYHSARMNKRVKELRGEPVDWPNEEITGAFLVDPFPPPKKVSH